MPIYEYACESCGHKLEKMQRMNEPPLTDCERCHAHSLKKLVSAAGFRLKGSGWYETDFKKETDKKKNLVSEESIKSETPASADSGSETNTSKEVPKETPKDTKKGETSGKNDSKAATTES